MRTCLIWLFYYFVNATCYRFSIRKWRMMVLQIFDRHSPNDYSNILSWFFNGIRVMSWEIHSFTLQQLLNIMMIIIISHQISQPNQLGLLDGLICNYHRSSFMASLTYEWYINHHLFSHILLHIRWAWDPNNFFLYYIKS